MKTKNLCLMVAGFLLASHLAWADPLGTAFTYQGRLTDGGQPANGSYDLKFTLYDDPANGSVVGVPVTNSPVMVFNGLFTTTLDFGPVIGRLALWLQVGVRSNGLATEFMRLS